MSFFVDESRAQSLRSRVLGRPTSTEYHFWCPDGETIYYFGAGSPVFSSTNDAVCSSWAPKVFPWNHSSKITQVATGNSVVLFLTEDNRVFGTGTQNQFGQLGPTGGIQEMEMGKDIVEIPVPTSDRIVQIEVGVGASSSVVLTESGDVFSCGELPGRPVNASAPANQMIMVSRESFDNIPVRHVSVGGCMCAYLTADGAVYITGYGGNAEARGMTAGLDAIHGHGITIPVKLNCLWDAGVRVTMISCGRLHTIVVGKNINTQETVVYGWGGNRNGQLGEDHRKLPDFLEPTLLTSVLSKMTNAENEVDEIVHVAAGWYHTLVTLKSGRVLSLASTNLYGQIGRSAPTVYPIPADLEVNACDFMLLDRPVQAAFPGSFFSILIPSDSTAITTTSAPSSSSNVVIGTCGIGGGGQLALWGDDIQEWNCYQCRMITRFFTFEDAIESAKHAPVLPPAEEMNYGNRRQVNISKRRQRDNAWEEEEEEEEEEDGQAGIDGDDDEGIFYLRIDFNDLSAFNNNPPASSTSEVEENAPDVNEAASTASHALNTLPTRLIPALKETWELSSTTNLLEEIQAKLTIKEQKEQEKAAKDKRKYKKVINPYHRYILVIVNHYDIVDIADLITLFSQEVASEDPLVAHVRERLAGLHFVSCSLYAQDKIVIGKLGLLLRNRERLPCFSRLGLEQTSLLDHEAYLETVAKGDMVPQFEDAVFAELMKSLLHAQYSLMSSSTSACDTTPTPNTTLTPSPIEILTFCIVSGIGPLTLRAITDSLSSYPDPVTQVSLRKLLCQSIGYAYNERGEHEEEGEKEEELNEELIAKRLEELEESEYAAIRDLLLLNVPSLTHVQLMGQDTTMNSYVAAVLAPALSKNCWLQQLWLSVSELGVEGVGVKGVSYLFEALRAHDQPSECCLYDIDISGDDGQPSIYDSKDAKKLSKLWQSILKRNGNNFLRKLNAKREELNNESAGKNKMDNEGKRRSGRNNRAALLPNVSATEKEYLEYVASRPWDANAEQWIDEFEYVERKPKRGKNKNNRRKQDEEEDEDGSDDGTIYDKKLSL